MDAQYEWRDETGLGHPSLVILDVTGISEQGFFIKKVQDAPILKVRKINSFDVCFRNNGKILLSRVRIPKGFKLSWYQLLMDRNYYALVVAVKRAESSVITD